MTIATAARVTETPQRVDDHIASFLTNHDEVERLTAIHTRVAGAGPGYKHAVEVLNKSAIVLLVACWEAFVEDLATAAFDQLMSHARSPTIFPPKVLTLASAGLRADSDARRVWELAGDGWKSVLRAHRQKTLEEFVAPLNTPRAEQCDRLFTSLVGVRLSHHWHWRGMTVNRAQNALSTLITLRGEIAHRVAASRSVRLKYVRDMGSFVVALAIASHNAITDELKNRIGTPVWDRIE